MEFGVHLPQLDLDGSGPPGAARAAAVVDAARELGLAAVSANDHLTFPRPWTDGPTLLAAVADRAGELDLVTTVGLPTLRGPVPYAAAMSALTTLSRGRVVAGIGPGSSRSDHALAGVPWEERWARFDEAARVLRALLAGTAPPRDVRWYPVDEPPSSVVPCRPVELWLASWGSPRGLRRVASYGDGWLASAHHGTAQDFGGGLRRLGDELRRAGRDPGGFGHAVVTMWLWITDDRADAARSLVGLAAALGRPPEELADRVCIGSPGRCVEVLTAYAEQGCRRVHVWPLADEPAQLARLVQEVAPHLPS